MPQKKPAKKPALTSPTPGSTGPMDVVLLERLIKLMAENDLSALDVKDGTRRVSLKRGPQYVAGGAMIQAPSVAASSAPAPRAEAAPATPAKPADDTAGLVAIKSPMVGTFYSAPSPDAKPFVSVGSNVDDDTDVCIIEAMKVFNNIKAETRGTIAKVCVNTGQTVEFGTVLFLVRP